MSELEKNMLDDSELEDVNGGLILNSLVYRDMGKQKKRKGYTLESRGKCHATLETLEMKPSEGKNYKEFI